MAAPPPPPPPPSQLAAPPGVTSKPIPAPHVPSSPADALLLELITYNGAPFNNHWAYLITPPDNRDIGTKMHATGNVRDGFVFEVKRHLNLRTDEDGYPTSRVALGWQRAGVDVEEILASVATPGKTLNTVNDGIPTGKRVRQKDCQTWIVESAGELVRRGVLDDKVAAYLRAVQQ